MTIRLFKSSKSPMMWKTQEPGQVLAFIGHSLVGRHKNQTRSQLSLVMPG